MPEPVVLPPQNSRGLSRRNVLIGGVLACASGVAFANQPRIVNPFVDGEKFGSWIPRAVGSWRIVSESGVVLPPPDTLRDRLYDNLETRVYSAGGLPPVMLLLAYNNAQSGVVQVHRPEVCYPVGGFQLSPTRDTQFESSLGIIPANFFTATSPNRVEQVEYFTRLGSAFPRTWVEQRVAVVKANLEGNIPDGMMMRVSALGLDPLQAQALLEGFARDFIDNSNPSLQRLLLGSQT